MQIHDIGVKEMRATAYISAFLVFVLPLPAESFGDVLGVRLVRVYDGDTFFVNIEGVHPLLGDEIGIRVRGVDTPEIRGKCDREKELAQAARRFAEDALLGATSVDLLDVERGKYFRIVADVSLDGANLAQLLIDNGLGVSYDGKGKRHDWCE